MLGCTLPLTAGIRFDSSGRCLYAFVLQTPRITWHPAYCFITVIALVKLNGGKNLRARLRPRTTRVGGLGTGRRPAGSSGREGTGASMAPSAERTTRCGSTRAAVKRCQLRAAPLAPGTGNQLRRRGSESSQSRVQLGAPTWMDEEMRSPKIPAS